MARFAKDYRELEVYRQANAVALRAFELSKAFPREEAYELTSQLRRATRSIGAQVAEAWESGGFPVISDRN
jgi:four helix bundle protein